MMERTTIREGRGSALAQSMAAAIELYEKEH